MKKLILLLTICAMGILSHAQGSFYKLYEMSVGTDYNAADDTYTWTEYTSCDVLMFVGDDNVITIYSKQEQVYKIVSQNEIIKDELMLLMCLDDMGYRAELTFFTTNNGMYMMVNYPQKVSWSYRLVAM